MTRKISRGDIQHLHALGAMKDKGILTPEEFANQKALLLAASEQPKSRTGSRFGFWAVGAAATLLLIVASVGAFGERSTAQAIGTHVHQASNR